GCKSDTGSQSESYPCRNAPTWSWSPFHQPWFGTAESRASEFIDGLPAISHQLFALCAPAPSSSVTVKSCGEAVTNSKKGCHTAVASARVRPWQTIEISNELSGLNFTCSPQCGLNSARR